MLYVLEQAKLLNKTPIQIMTEMKEKWANLSPEQKAKYQQEAEARKLQYEKDMDIWEKKMIDAGRTDLIRGSSQALLGPVRKPKVLKSEQGGGCLHSTVSAGQSGGTGESVSLASGDPSAATVKTVGSSAGDNQKDYDTKADDVKVEKGEDSKIDFFKRMKDFFKIQIFCTSFFLECLTYFLSV